MSKFIIAMLAVCSTVLLPRTAQAKTFSGDHYSIGFGTAWDTVQTHSILGKYLGLQGMATMTADLGTSLPNLDSLTAAYSDSLGGKITKDSSGRMTIGKYDVHWQKFTYDSLPKLSAAVSKATGMSTTLKKGEFRVYYLNSTGVSFSIACMSIVSGVKAPYADVEAALATLTLTTQTGIIPLAPGFSRDIWVKDGKLGGGWLKANRVFAVECYDTRGAFLGQATHAAEGAWQLPKAQAEMLVRLKTASGNGMHFLVRP
ncbi:MAG: hypothetical protein JF616_06040 [Fibrobacteres bacterium]|jgi:hypothetical protein|nr:hypothetical protein [Fibrobacterota bacterium]